MIPFVVQVDSEALEYNNQKIMFENPEKYKITLSLENIDTNKITTGEMTLAQLIENEKIMGSSALNILLSKILEINQSEK